MTLKIMKSLSSKEIKAITRSFNIGKYTEKKLIDSQLSLIYGEYTDRKLTNILGVILCYENGDVAHIFDIIVYDSTNKENTIYSLIDALTQNVHIISGDKVIYKEIGMFKKKVPYNKLRDNTLEYESRNELVEQALVNYGYKGIDNDSSELDNDTVLVKYEEPPHKVISDNENSELASVILGGLKNLTDSIKK